MTRAEQKLYLTYSQTRTLWGGTTYNLKSRFLDEAEDSSLLNDRSVSIFCCSSFLSCIDEIVEVDIVTAFANGIKEEDKGGRRGAEREIKYKRAWA